MGIAEPASIEEMATVEFTPWARHDSEWTPPSNEEWTSLANPHLISVRLAWLTLHKSKGELIEAAEHLGGEALMDLVGQIGRSADRFEGLRQLLASAETRIMCALGAQRSREDGRHQRRFSNPNC